MFLSRKQNHEDLPPLDAGAHCHRGHFPPVDRNGSSAVPDETVRNEDGHGQRADFAERHHLSPGNEAGPEGGLPECNHFLIRPVLYQRGTGELCVSFYFSIIATSVLIKCFFFVYCRYWES